MSNDLKNARADFEALQARQIHDWLKSEDEKEAAALQVKITAMRAELPSLKKSLPEFSAMSQRAQVQFLKDGGVLNGHGSAGMSRKEFDTLSPREKSDYCLKGGKLRD